jgi:hypothetical protein
MARNEIEDPVAKKKNGINWDVARDKNKKNKKNKRKNKSSRTYRDSVFDTSSIVRKILMKQF